MKVFPSAVGALALTGGHSVRPVSAHLSAVGGGQSEWCDKERSDQDTEGRLEILKMGKPRDLSDASEDAVAIIEGVIGSALGGISAENAVTIANLFANATASQFFTLSDGSTLALMVPHPLDDGSRHELQTTTTCRFSLQARCDHSALDPDFRWNTQLLSEASLGATAWSKHPFHSSVVLAPRASTSAVVVCQATAVSRRKQPCIQVGTLDWSCLTAGHTFRQYSQDTTFVCLG
jgi:hypothetical protein